MEQNINKEKLMKFISEAFDLGATLRISFYTDSNIPEETGKMMADEFAEIVGSKTEETFSTDYQSRWFKVDGNHDFTVFHENSKDKKGLKKLVEKLDKEEELA